MIDTIYIEEEVIDHPRTRKILNFFSKARHISIYRHGELFNKRSQNFRLQKSKPALILAKKHSGHILPTPEGFGVGGTRNFYFAHMSNCLYDCRYCFLQGMYSSANYIVYVNFEDFDLNINKLVNQYPNEKLTFFSGYDCDSLAFEKVTGFAAHILPRFSKYKSSLLEFRTKSVQLAPLTSITPIENCIIAFSLIPSVMSRVLDHKAPSIERRIKAIKSLADKGWKIGLRFDPLIHGCNWQNHYEKLFFDVFSILPESAIHSVTYGALRFPQAMFRKIFKLYPHEPLFSSSLLSRNGITSYKQEIEEEMSEFCYQTFKKYVSDALIFQCTPEVQAKTQKKG